MVSQLSRLQQEREKLLNSWSKNEGSKIKILVRIMELEEQIDALKKGA